MIASVSIAARGSLRGTSTTRVSAGASSGAVRKAKPPATSTSCTGRSAHCAATAVSTARASTPGGSACCSRCGVTGRSVAKTSASASRSAWAKRPGSGVDSVISTAAGANSAGASGGSCILQFLGHGAAADQDGAEAQLLAQLDRAAAGGLERGDQRAGQGRALLHRVGQPVRQEALQHGPVRQRADQPAEPRQCLLHRPELPV